MVLWLCAAFAQLISTMACVLHCFPKSMDLSPSLGSITDGVLTVNFFDSETECAAEAGASSNKLSIVAPPSIALPM